MIEKISAKEYRRNVKDKIKKDLGAGYDELITNGQDVIICAKSKKGEIIGCAYGVNSKQVARNYVKEIDHNKLSSVLHTIWIDKDHRGKGLGTKLGSKLTDNLKSYTLTEVWVKSNGQPDSERLFKKLGYKKIGTIYDRWDDVDCPVCKNSNCICDSKVYVKK